MREMQVDEDGLRSNMWFACQNENGRMMQNEGQQDLQCGSATTNPTKAAKIQWTEGRQRTSLVDDKPGLHALSAVTGPARTGGALWVLRWALVSASVEVVGLVAPIVPALHTARTVLVLIAEPTPCLT